MPSRKTLSVEQELFIHAPPRKVFDAITTPQGLASWMVVRADLSPRTGAPYELEFDGGWLHEGSVHRFRPGRSLSLAWSWSGVPLTGTVLTMGVRARKGGTVFRLVHRGFPFEKRWMELYGGAERGWRYYGMNLKSVLETGHDLRSSLDG